MRSNAIAARPERAFPSIRSVVRAIRPCGSLRRRSNADHAARGAPPVHMIKLTARREISPYFWAIRTRSDSSKFLVTNCLGVGAFSFAVCLALGFGSNSTLFDFLLLLFILRRQDLRLPLGGLAFAAWGIKHSWARGQFSRLLHFGLSDPFCSISIIGMPGKFLWPSSRIVRRPGSWRRCLGAGSCLRANVCILTMIVEKRAGERPRPANLGAALSSRVTPTTDQDGSQISSDSPSGSDHLVARWEAMIAPPFSTGRPLHRGAHSGLSSV